MNARKRILMGADYTVSVPLTAYGGAVFKVHAIPDMEMAQIEEKTGYTLTEFLQMLQPEDAEAAKNKKLSAEAQKKLFSKMTPKMKLFMGEICKAGLLPDDPDPECPICGGKLEYKSGNSICKCRDLTGMVDKLKGFSILELGTAVIGASLSDWKEIEDFFSARKEASGPA